MNRTIHYIWLGGRRKPRVIRKCIATWRRLMPDWEIKEWNETNLDIDCCAFCREAYEAGKYAFAADVLRFEILYREGGLYFDTDVKLLRSLTPLCERYDAFAGYEYTMVAPGLVLYAKAPHDSILGEMLTLYHHTHFQTAEGQNTKVVGAYFSEILEGHGFVYEDKQQTCGSFTILPSTYFCPTDGYGNPLNYTADTHSVHLFAASWMPPAVRARRAIKRFFYRILGKDRVQGLMRLFRKNDKREE